MKPVLISRHVANEGPGYLADFLQHHGIEWHLACIDQKQALPPSIEDFSGLVFMGGTMSVNDNLPWIKDAVNLIQRAQQSGMPVLGHCLGGQLIAKALGAEVNANPVREYGWHKVELCRNRETAGWLGNVASPVDAFHWHGETFSLPDTAHRLLTNRHCINQGFVAGNMLALQCHIEMTEALIDAWISSTTDLPPASASVQTPEQMREHLHQRLANMRTLADRLYGYWVTLLE